MNSVNISTEERDEVQKVIHDSIGWALTKDIKRLFSIMAQDDDFFIFHPDSKSTIIGFDSFKNMAERSWMTDAFKATDFTVKELRINFSTSSMVAWYSAILDDHGEWNGQPSGWDNVRWTGVLEKRDGQWVIAQMHFSFATDQISK
ncbi:MAG: nuclear transport factor 2 family protein [Anaerolineales bacterium]|nr:nuclear transport factor 2 family protein [Anaerolineales bacterium]